MKKLKASLGIDDTFTKVRNKKKQYSNVKDNIPLKEDYNFMADIMHLPTDKFGFKYLLVVVDLANDQFDMEPLKHRDADATLKGLKKMFTREYINKPYASITTDAGTEFRGVFQKYLYHESIYHKTTRVGRHKQLGNVDNLIRQISSLIIGLLNKEEMKTKKHAKGWTKYIDNIRDKLNEIRVKELPKDDDDTRFDYPSISTRDEKGKAIRQRYKVGDMVHVQLDSPTDANGNKQLGSAFREQDNRFDLEAREIVKVLYYTGNVLHRYMVKGITNASYTDNELFKAS